MGWFIRLFTPATGSKKSTKPSPKLGIDGRVIYTRRTR